MSEKSKCCGAELDFCKVGGAPHWHCQKCRRESEPVEPPHGRCPKHGTPLVLVREDDEAPQSEHTQCLRCDEDENAAPAQPEGEAGGRDAAYWNRLADAVYQNCCIPKGDSFPKWARMHSTEIQEVCGMLRRRAQDAPARKSAPTCSKCGGGGPFYSGDGPAKVKRCERCMAEWVPAPPATEGLADEALAGRLEQWPWMVETHQSHFDGHSFISDCRAAASALRCRREVDYMKLARVAAGQIMLSGMDVSEKVIGRIAAALNKADHA